MKSWIQYGVSVTAGANQALASLMITLLDPQDRTVVFRPYYFNALMAVQMMGGGNTISYGPSDPDTFHPDLDWLEEELKGPNKPQLVYLVNPCNPTGNQIYPLWQHRQGQARETFQCIELCGIENEVSLYLV